MHHRLRFDSFLTIVTSIAFQVSCSLVAVRKATLNARPRLRTVPHLLYNNFNFPEKNLCSPDRLMNLYNSKLQLSNQVKVDSFKYLSVVLDDITWENILYSIFGLQKKIKFSVWKFC